MRENEQRHGKGEDWCTPGRANEGWTSHRPERETENSKRKMIRPVKEKDGQTESLRIRTPSPKSFQGSCPYLFQPARTLLPSLPFSRHLGHFHLKVCILPVPLLSHVPTSMVSSWRRAWPIFQSVQWRPTQTLCVLSNYLTPVSPFALHKFQDLLTPLPSHLHPIVKPNEYMKAVRKSHFFCVCTERQKLTGQWS